MCSPRLSPFSTAVEGGEEARIVGLRGSACRAAGAGWRRARRRRRSRRSAALSRCQACVLDRRAHLVARAPRQSAGALGEAELARRCWRAGRRPPSSSPRCRCGPRCGCGIPTGPRRAGRASSRRARRPAPARAKSSARRLAEQPLVEEGLGVGEDDLAVGVVLDLGVGGVADPHRPHAAIAGQRRRPSPSSSLGSPDTA